MYYVEANEASIRIVGEDFTNRYIRDIDPNYESFWYEIFGQVALTGKSMRMEQYAGPDKKWYSFNIFKIGDVNSRRIGNIFLDITESKQAEETFRLRLEQEVNNRTAELKESKELSNAIIQAQDISLCVFKAVRDDEGNIIDLEYTFANDITKKLAYNLNLGGMLYSKVFYNAEESGILDILRDVIETGKTFNGEDAFVYYNEDGTEFMMSGYTFSNSSSGKSLTIRFQNDTLPLTDTRYQLENQEVTRINGEDIVIGYYKDLDAYFTAFVYKGFGYELTGMQGISQDDFIHIVQSILQ